MSALFSEVGLLKGRGWVLFTLESPAESDWWQPSVAGMKEVPRCDLWWSQKGLSRDPSVPMVSFAPGSLESGPSRRSPLASDGGSKGPGAQGSLSVAHGWSSGSGRWPAGWGEPEPVATRGERPGFSWFLARFLLLVLLKLGCHQAPLHSQNAWVGSL